jgi:dolichol-phosphate mannosyltransferase
MQKIKHRPFRPEISILLPIRNEGLNIILMLKILEAILSFSHEILIIYDDKNDTTIPTIKRMQLQYQSIQPVLNTYGKGVKNAIMTGVTRAKGKYLLILAVDDVGPSLAIDNMVKLMDSGCDFVSCTRYKYGGRRLGGSLIEGALSRTGNILFTILCGSALSDATTGFKMFKKDVFSKINLESNPVGWAVVFEMSIKAQASGLKLGEVPIISIDRLYGGKSSFRLFPWFKEYGRWFIYGMRHYKDLYSNKKVSVSIPKSTII